jgi:hypothetical protein
MRLAFELCQEMSDGSHGFWAKGKPGYDDFAMEG